MHRKSNMPLCIVLSLFLTACGTEPPACNSEEVISAIHEKILKGVTDLTNNGTSKYIYVLDKVYHGSAKYDVKQLINALGAQISDIRQNSYDQDSKRRTCILAYKTYNNPQMDHFHKLIDINLDPAHLQALDQDKVNRIRNAAVNEFGVAYFEYQRRNFHNAQLSNKGINSDILYNVYVNDDKTISVYFDRPQPVAKESQPKWRPPRPNNYE